ncbi:MAG TPA: peptide chain release factor 3 [Methylomusa anaerophila]|uniref:Peptide chain release factor 3 n=1 Tax=Methylomusa anaerophila TaxID=1930071 RepID=A0A348AP30_9FIRM|nr:peptide chain release factor 3 [Methylomusa anaerophila]BBB92828.1 peptide chain release factor 3 [Methylomusa anaerophila]HML87332.1 peptide chain release factor 3 [Methylomusa anaerophila]
MIELETEVQKRRTFAIISHPDAGKTTLTEKLLLFGGAIRLAGSVKSRKAQKHAVSDWMEIEKQRGISVTSSVLQFDYNGYKVNILDTPGHQDFSEDTYRTLMAADSAVMLIDAAKGVEDQTKKLFQVCKQRGIPVFTFVNKLDRYGRNPFDLMEELEKVLGIRAYPMNWPIGIDGNYSGIYIRNQAQVELFEQAGVHGQSALPSSVGGVDDPRFKEALGEEIYHALCDDITLLDMAGDEFNIEKVGKGELTPMFFGSAMTNFGVRLFLEEFLQLAPPPVPRVSSVGVVNPSDENFSAFVFKIQANMNPAHRDRLAFIRICSGKFSRGMSVFHPHTGKSIKLAQPQQFLAQERTIIEEAYPGDIIGLFDPGVFGIGDTLCQEGSEFRFQDFPIFPPEQFARVQAKDTMKRKQFVKGMTQLTQEGAVQIFRQPDYAVESFVVGVVGSLQFEVLEYRLKHEYGVDIVMNRLPYTLARWLMCENCEDIDLKLKSMKNMDNGMLVQDVKDRPVALISNEWQLRWVEERNPGIEFLVVPQDARAI